MYSKDGCAVRGLTKSYRKGGVVKKAKGYRHGGMHITDVAASGREAANDTAAIEAARLQAIKDKLAEELRLKNEETQSTGKVLEGMQKRQDNKDAIAKRNEKLRLGEQDNEFNNETPSGKAAMIKKGYRTKNQRAVGNR